MITLTHAMQAALLLSGDNDADPSELRELAERYVSEYAATMKELTPRDREVLRLICLGSFNAGIASNCDVSQRTIENTRRKLFDAFAAKSAAQLGFAVGVATALAMLLHNTEPGSGLAEFDFDESGEYGEYTPSREEIDAACQQLQLARGGAA